MLPGPPPPPPVLPDAPRPDGRTPEERVRRRVALTAGSVAALLFVGVVAYSFGLSDPGLDHPDEWDARVVDLVDFVEDERGLRFEHPVHIDFLTPEEYREATQGGAVVTAQDDDEGMDEMYEAASMLRSLGLLSGEVDLQASIEELNDSGTLAFYDPLIDRIVVRGTEIDVNLEATLVHELVHALQDQHFDLGRLGDMQESGEAAAFRAVVEGDASLVESRWVERLGGDELTAYEETAAAQADAALAHDVPGVLIASMGSSYVLGEPLVGIVHAQDGWDGVDDLLRDPPTSELELFDVLAYLDGFTPVSVEAPEVADGDVVIDEGELGAISLYLMLAARIDPFEALQAADQWAGDAYVTSRDLDGRLCTRIHTSAGDAAGTDVLASAFGSWVAAAPAESGARMDRADGRLELTSCDPGPGSDTGIVVDPLQAIALPANRSFIVFLMVEQGFDVDVGLCVTDEVFEATPLKGLIAPDPPPQLITEVQQTLGSAVVSCQSSG